MKTLTLKNKFQTNATLLPNDFIDNYMIDANGEFVKVYLFLLRHLDDPFSSLTLTTIADCLNNTEKDILRAFRYWESAGLLALERDSDGRVTGLELRKTMSTEKESASDKSAPAAVTGTADMKKAVPLENKAVPLNAFRTQKELKSLLFIAEQYLGKTLTRTDVDTITYFYETLNMSVDLIEYLIEYCVENGHKSMHYIQKVALSWNERHLTTVDEAKADTLTYNRTCYSVLNAFGIKGRAPAASEITYIRKWNEEYGFSLDLILEACGRTMSAIHQPSFDYTDSILKNWLKKNVYSLGDVEALDAAYLKEKESKKKRSSSRTAGNNKFNNFESRSYDMSDLERKLVQQ